MGVQDNANEIHSKSMIFLAFPSTLRRTDYTQKENNRVGRMIVGDDVIEIALPCTDGYLDVRAARNFGRKK